MKFAQAEKGSMNSSATSANIGKISYPCVL